MEKIIIVGNGYSLLNKKNGLLIDTFNKVVRMSNSVDKKGFSEYIGEKIDIYSALYYNVDSNIIKNVKTIINLPFVQLDFTQRIIRDFLEDIKDYKENILHLANKDDYKIFKNIFKKYVKSEFKNDYIYSKFNNDFNFSLGFKTICYIKTLYPNSKVYVTGFDFFTTGAFWNENHNRHVSNHHNYIFEKLWYKKALKNKFIFEL